MSNNKRAKRIILIIILISITLFCLYIGYQYDVRSNISEEYPYTLFCEKLKLDMTQNEVDDALKMFGEYKTFGENSDGFYVMYVRHREYYSASNIQTVMLVYDSLEPDAKLIKIARKNGMGDFIELPNCDE